MFAIVQKDSQIPVSMMFYLHQMLCIMYQKNVGTYLPLYFFVAL